MWTSNQCRDLKRSTIFCRVFPLKSEWFPAKDWVFHTCFIADVMPPHLALGASIFLPHKDDGRGQPVEPGKVVDCNSLPQIAPVRFPLDWGVNSSIFSCNLYQLLVFIMDLLPWDAGWRNRQLCPYHSYKSCATSMCFFLCHLLFFLDRWSQTATCSKKIFTSTTFVNIPTACWIFPPQKNNP